MTDKLIALSINYISHDDFESWVQGVLSMVEKYQFEPTGGVHDGGQDGFIRPLQGDINHYVQISKEKDTRAKIKKTLQSLKKSKRQVSQLTYVTSQSESDIDIMESNFTKEFGLRIRIHNLRWLTIQAGLYKELKDSLYVYAKPLIDELQYASNIKRDSNFSDKLSIITYLETHSHAMEVASNFQILCLDTLIYNALRETDPDQDKFQTIDQISITIKAKYANFLSKCPKDLINRLNWLSSKDNALRIRKHGPDKYALPFEVRNQFDEGNLKIKTQESEFFASINRRIIEEFPKLENKLKNLIAQAVQYTFIETFQNQAINFSHSFNKVDRDSRIEVFSIIRKFFELVKNLNEDELEYCILGTSKVFRHMCYSSTSQESEYIKLLMKYFSVHFVMNGDVAVNRYFSEMVKQLRIYLGTDIIVRCLSEIFVRPTSCGMTNALKHLQDSGVTLHLTRQVAEEVFSHIRTTYLTFQNEYENWYRLGSLEELKNCDKILIRAFFYAYFEPEKHVRKPRDWWDFLNQFGGNSNWFKNKTLHIDDFTSYLIGKFHFEFIETDELMKKIDHDLANRVAQRIMSDRNKISSLGHEILAHNDAKMALLINVERFENKERVNPDLYGYNTWWMTEEKTVLKSLREEGERNDIVMQPQFLINHYLLNSITQKSESNNETPLTPTLFGLRITDRVEPFVMQKFLDEIKMYSEFDEAALNSKIRSAANIFKKS